MNKAISVLLAAFFTTACSVDTFGGEPDSGGDADPSEDAQTDGDGGTKLKYDAGDAADGDALSDATDAPAPTFKRVFITAETYLASLGGTTGADAKCQAVASKAGLSGTYMAWLSTPSSTPKTRFTQSTLPYRMLDGTTVATSFASLTSLGTLLHPIDRDENNLQVIYNAATGAGMAWTQTKYDGTYQTFTGTGGCSGFTSTAADEGLGGCDDKSTNQWSMCADMGCALVGQQAAGLSLYCFEQ